MVILMRIARPGASLLNSEVTVDVDMCKQRTSRSDIFRLRLSRLLKEWGLDGSGELIIHSELYTIPRFTVGAMLVLSLCFVCLFCVFVGCSSGPFRIC